MELRTLNIMKGGYQGEEAHKVLIPTDIKWVRWNGVSSGGLHNDHTNYWTITRCLPQSAVKMMMDTGYGLGWDWFDKNTIIWTLNNVLPCFEKPQLTTASAICKKYRLDKYVFVHLHDMDTVTEVLRLVKMEHPSSVLYNRVILHNPINKKECLELSTMAGKINDLTDLYKGESIAIQPSMNAEHVWAEAVDAVVSKVGYETGLITHDIDWKMPGLEKDNISEEMCRLIYEKGEKPDEETVKKWNEAIKRWNEVSVKIERFKKQFVST